MSSWVQHLVICGSGCAVASDRSLKRCCRLEFFAKQSMLRCGGGVQEGIALLHLSILFLFVLACTPPFLQTLGIQNAVNMNPLPRVHLLSAQFHY
eukprot:424927-Amphidinium_carterae.1